MKINKIIKIVILIITSALVISPFTSCESLAFGDNGKFIKLKNVPLGQPVYYSPTEVFFPYGYFEGEDLENRKTATAKIYNIETQQTMDLGVKMNIPPETGLTLIHLSDGRIFITGGLSYFRNSIRHDNVVEIYNPKTNRFKITGETKFFHSNHSNSNYVKFDNKIVFVTNKGVEVFDILTNKFDAIYTMEKQYNYLLSHPQITKLGDEYAYININYHENYTYANDDFLYFLKTNTVVPVTKDILASILKHKNLASLTTFGDERLLLNNNIYSLAKSDFYKTDGPVQRMTSYKLMLLSNKNVLLYCGKEFFDGWIYRPRRYMELYNPVTNKYTKLSKKTYSENCNAINMDNNTVFIKADKNEYYLYKY